MTDVPTAPPPDATTAAPEPSIVERVRNRRGEGDRLRYDLLDAAADLMAEKGDIDGVSLRAIAARAGVSPTAVYRHFDDHVSLLRAAVEHCWREFEAALLSASHPEQDPFERMRASGRAYMAFAFEQPGKYRVLFSNQIDLGSSDQTVGETAFDWLVGLVTDVLEANGDDRDPTFVAVQVHTWIHGIVDLCARHTEFDWPDQEIQLDELAYRLGIVARDSPAPEPGLVPATCASDRSDDTAPPRPA